MTETTMKKPSGKIFSNRNFILLWIGSSISIVGSQFSTIALPWLMLQLTGDPLALGMVLAVAGISRAAFMLIGGVISDRFPPRNILLLGDYLNFLLTALAATLVFFGLMQIWMVYVFGLFTGILSGFMIPASNSILPSLVPEEDLQVGNSVAMGSNQLASFIGPAVAGVIIGAYSQASLGITIALAVDAITFGVSALFLGAMRNQQQSVLKEHETILIEIRKGWDYVWNHTGIRFMFTLVAAVNFLFVGPLLVGIPVLADQRLPEGAQAFGYLMSAFAGGNLVGLILAGALPKASGRTLMVIVIGLFVAFGVALITLGWLTSTTIDIVLMVIIGLGNGYLTLIIYTWIQTHTPKEMLGRVMSLLMLASLGLVPLSQAVAGLISKWNLTNLFLISGGMILLLAIWAAFQPGLRSLSEEMSSSNQ